MSETLQYKFNSGYLYTHPDYEVFNLIDFDKNAECKILITNQGLQSEVSSSIIDNKIVELLVPIKDKNFLISKIPYFKNLLKDDNLFGDKPHVEIDGQKCLIIRDQDPRIFANILKMLHTGKSTYYCMQKKSLGSFRSLAHILGFPAKMDPIMIPRPK